MTTERCPLAEAEAWSGYLDDDLDADARAELERHLMACQACAASLTGLGAVVSATRAVGGIAPPVGLWPQIAGRLDSRHPAHRTHPVAIWLAAAAILLTIGIALTIGGTDREPVPTEYAADATATAALRDALATIDKAIRDSEAALAGRPDDPFLLRSLETARMDRAQLLGRTSDLLERVQ